MLQPRETDFLALLLVLVVLPLVIYILLGKWSEDTKRKERISLLAHLAAEEAIRAESMAAASVVVPLVPHSTSNNVIHACARCSSPATTRCSQCKAVRYCSGKCQIIHWRHVHKHECHQLDTSSDSSHIAAPVEESMHELFPGSGRMISQCTDDWTHTSSGSADSCISNDTPGVSITEKRSIDRRVSRKSKLRRDEEILPCSTEGASVSSISCSNLSDRDGRIKHKIKDGGLLPLDESHSKHNMNVSDGFNNVDSSNHCIVESDLLSARESFDMDSHGSKDQTVESNCNSSVISTTRSIRSKTALNPSGAKVHKSHKSSVKMSREQPGSEMERKGQVVEVGGVKEITQGSNGATSMGIMKMIGLRKPSKLARQETSEANGQRHKKLKMLFPYDDFLKLFEYGVYDISPTGLINCGNSCYANAVLQCLTYTKPLTSYLLRRLHSRTCCTKNWCLMCELEQHVKMLRQSGGPASPGRILSQMRHINRHMGDGSQEDAHEFLRLLVTSMQSICLEGLGGEKVVDPRLQETTFIQHTFGGSLKSKVKCLRCHHESERYENIMDLTLEIYGWVESLEDALTQFTTPEDLDGENMYRCGSCAAYVRARKQLSIREAPNILTIVLKRFQEGSYGKINKCITFPDMLDMVPFMTGTDDIPPLYMLYAVVVHLDMLNASFSGHYVSYVKDLRGNWYRIDDTEVQPVPMSQVMSEGAYILFYMRSCPRPARASSGKHSSHQSSKSHKSSRPGQSKSSCHLTGPETSANLRMMNRNIHPSTESYAESHNMEFSDATSSDFSIFTSSDEASFTTESTRDSFSTVDYADACNDPIASIFNAPYGPDYSSRRTISCNMFSSSKPQTRFASEVKGFVMDSYLLNEPPVDRTTTSSPSSQHCKV